MLAAEALFGLGESYFLQAEYALAIDVYGHFLEDYPEAPQLSQVLRRLAIAYRERGEWEQAVEAYERYIDTLSRPAAPALYGHLAEAYRQMGANEKAATMYEQALAGQLPRSTRLDFEEELALLYRRMDEPDQATDHFEQALALASYDSYKAHLLYEIGVTWQKADEPTKAIRWYREAMDRYPEENGAYQSLVALLEMDEKVDVLERAIVDYYADQYSITVELLEDYIASYETPSMITPTTNITGTEVITVTPTTKPTLSARERADLTQARFYLGLSYRFLEDYEAAIENLERLIAEDPQSGLVPSAMYQIGRCWELFQAPERALDVYADLVQAYPSYTLADLVLWRQAHAFERLDRRESASEAYHQLATAYPTSNYAADAQFWAGMVLYEGQDFEAAIKAWQAASVKAKGAQAARLLLWLGKAYAALAEEAQAEAQWQKAQEAAPDDYYALRAHRHLTEYPNEIVPEPSNPDWFELAHYPKPPRASETVVDWLQSWYSPTLSLTEAQVAISTRPAYQYGQQALVGGAREDARAEFRQLYYDLVNEPLKLYALALDLQEMGLYRLASASVERIIRLADLPIGEIPSDLLRISYPVHYAELIIAEAEAYGVDPRLFFALVRQESRFDPRATSWAGARGLAQVMPATGEWIALRLGHHDFDTYTLYRPTQSVSYGLWYLAVALDMFEGNILAALAGYNGGPGNVERWAGGLPVEDTDAFVENITAAEPELYVKTIWEQYHVYRQLYPIPDRP
jgi:soluble lytic murein transglycosylase